MISIFSSVTFVPAFKNGLEFIDVVLDYRFFHVEGHIKSNCC